MSADEDGAVTPTTEEPVVDKFACCGTRNNAFKNLYGNLQQCCTSSQMQMKIVEYLMMSCDCESGLIAFISDDDDELSCQVIGDKIIEEEIKLPSSCSYFNLAITSKSSIRLRDISDEVERKCSTNALERRLSMSNNQISGITINNILCVPVVSRGAKVAFIVCLINKRTDPGGTDTGFTVADEEIVEECCYYTKSLLINTIAYEAEKRLRLQCQSLLTVAQNLFSHLDEVRVLLREIMTEARNLTKAERCSLFLLDKENDELVAQVFDGFIPNDDTDAANHDSCKDCCEVRISSSKGIAGHVATTGELMNIRDAYSHPLFYSALDESTGFKTRNILCFPIKDDNKEMIGVAQLCNKINAKYFSTFDEDIAVAFSIYCGIAIMHSLMYKRVRDAQYRSKLSNELMMYHMQVMNEDVAKLATIAIPPLEDLYDGFCQFSFPPRILFPESDTPTAVISMFENFGIISKWRIRRVTLARFVLMVRKGYRETLPYHNWMHAFSVIHFCTLLLNNLNLIQEGLVSELESLCLLVACMCHDLDHRGTTNSFQVSSDSVLAALYSSEGSVMERHHFAQTMCILNTEGCNIFESLSRKDYEQCLDLVRDLILATDLAQHLQSRILLDQIITNGLDVRKTKQRSLFLNLIMTASDLNDQTKDWASSKRTAEYVYREFFSQGDLEKAMGKSPSAMMDREKACIPELQISFITEITQPVYNYISDLFPHAVELSAACANNLQCWLKMKAVVESKSQPMSLSPTNGDQGSSSGRTLSDRRRSLVCPFTSVDIFEDKDLELQVLTEVQAFTETTDL